MKYILNLVLLVFFLASCSQNQKAENKIEIENFTDLAFIGVNDTLFLSVDDDKCGEWGGDFKGIRVYREMENKREALLLDLIQSTMNCDSIDKYIDNPRPRILDKTKIVVDDLTLKLISESINEIVQIQMKHKAVIFSHSGNFSSMTLSNKQMRITIYPSPQWTKFEYLFDVLKKKHS